MGLAVTGMAIPTITWESLHAYEQLNGWPLEAWERRALMQLSSARAHVLSIRSEQKDVPANGRKLPRRSNR
jgi:hypothetical protein